MKRILFVCTENACRSQMAEALANHFFAQEVKAFSAGIRPTKVNPLAKKVLEEVGINTGGLRSKSLSEFSLKDFDLIVTLCDSAAEECPFLPEANIIHWPFPDPAKEKDISTFRKVRDMIKAALPEIILKARS
ncbi:Protein-tyrosine phosphatase, low molecular weight [Thermodesulfatator indicus DSM 15286]|uniref:Protein-tyrosine phosphatase, low molecular weight n=1 Tax=Thermodesulfatator indicus (strain DSM 15286 / JCM 11887 / CIR29812) TaxID=667014 RepID=F8A8T1_THEID|nr:arsenate reductase ArsC [Thermodesulfatator indicus]AEH45049.1 Protein-tyrosine phosphatase, low molecular weight [Thermodesulfatator indicus DSM 15286]